MDVIKSDATKLIKTYDRLKEEQQTSVYAVTHGFSYINLTSYPFVADVIKIIPIEVAKQFAIIAFMKLGNVVRVATINPFTPGLNETMTSLGTSLGVTFEPYICSQTSIDFAMSRYDVFYKKEVESQVKAESESVSQFASKINNLKDLKEMVEKVPTTEMLEVLMSGALALDSSDIHLEPQLKGVEVRFRIDGRLLPIIELPEKNYLALASRIKNSARIKLDQKKVPQDGRFSVKVGSDEIDVRVSTIPSAYGETIVMRLLTLKNLLDLNQLGMSEDIQAAIMGAATKPQGLVLFTGPTGSGKTTSLYAVLQLLNQPEKKIITIEDPVEYRFEGIEQVQVNPGGGFDFADGLRSILRQDPDIIMVGEIRDKETAEIAVNASLTGHLVLSTLHTNNAVSAFVRLLQMGVPKYLLMDAISLIVAQRLVRRICSNCGGQGCDVCHHTGYHGRILIAEFFAPNEASSALIQREAPLSEFSSLFTSLGYRSMKEDGLNKVETGLTTEQEINSVTA